MKFLHTADLHLGYAQYGSSVREKDFVDMLWNIESIAYSNTVDAVILAGDVFNTPHPPGSAVQALQVFSASLRSKGIAIMGVMGNHDPAPPWLPVANIDYLDNEVLTVKGVRFTGLDFRRPAVFMKTLNDMSSGTKADVFILHQALAELASFSGIPLRIEEAAPIMASMGVKYVAMGDIHKRGSMALDGVLFSYPGSPERCSRDDSGPKSVNIVTMEQGSPASLKEVETSPRPVVNLNLTTEKDVMDIITEIESGKDFESLPVVYISYTGDIYPKIEALEDLMGKRGMVSRSTSVDDVDGTTVGVDVTPSLGSGDSLGILKEAVLSYFDKESDEAQLVIQSLETLDAATAVRNYYFGETA